MKNFLNGKKIVLVIFAILIAYFSISYIYHANIAHTLWVANRDSCQNTGGKFELSKCRCPRVFPIFNAISGRCQDAGGFSPSTKEEAIIYSKRYNFNIKCSDELKGEVYVFPGTSLTLCYSSSLWGDPAIKEIKDNSKIIYSLSFYKQRKLVSTAPQIWFFDHLVNFSAIKELPVGVCFNCVNLSHEIDEIKHAVDKNSLVDKVQKIAVDDRTGLYIKLKNSVSDYYYIPSAFGQSDMIVALPAQTTANNNFINNLWFDRLAQ